VLSLAHLSPQTQVTGIDVSETTIRFAGDISTQVPNAHFRLMAATSLLDFPDARFDLVHARYIFGFMPETRWPALLAECRRILRSGRIIVVTDGEMPTTNKPAVNRYTELFTRALLAAGQSFSAGGKQIGLLPVLPRLLAEAGFEPGGSQSYRFDFVTGTPEERESFFLNNYTAGFLLMQPFLLKAGVTTIAETGALYAQVLTEIRAPDFDAATSVLRGATTPPEFPLYGRTAML